MKILAIETSCDETAASIVEDGWKVHSNVIASQIAQHSETGGVVPEVASREHMKVILPVIRRALSEAKMTWKDIDSIAVTKEPGLIGSVLVGRMTASALSFALEKPLIEVNHIHGHLYSNWLAREEGPEFPIISLTVSGGHNDLVWIPEHGKIEILGQTVDDAAGEAFDKTARLLGLGYPGGPAIEKTAKDGSANVDFPRSRLDNYRFSFSGLKTAVLYYLQDHQDKLEDPKFIPDIAASFQAAAIDNLVHQLIKAVKDKSPKEVHLAGGVSANKSLRAKIASELDKLANPPIFRHPEEMSFCTDNAAMIAAAAYWGNLQ
jgi:N6-L-threonylcarbamoyladenine synthase